MAAANATPRILDALDAADVRITELEAAAQWRTMDTAPRDGTWVFALLTYHDGLPARFWEPPAIAVRWDSADGEWRDDRGVRKGDIAAWLPAPGGPGRCIFDAAPCVTRIDDASKILEALIGRIT